MESVLNKILGVISNAGGRLLAFLSISGASLAKINWQKPSWDLFVVLIFLIAVFLYGITLGKGRILVMLSAIYMSAIIAVFFPWNISAGILRGAPPKAAIFIAVLILLFFLLVRSGLASIFKASTEGNWIETFIFSFLQIGLLVAILIFFFPPEAIQASLPITGKIFADPIARFAWIIFPIIGIALTRKKRSYRRSESKDPFADLY